MAEGTENPPWRDGAPLTRAALHDYVERALHEIVGREVGRDEDGDLPVRFGSAMVYVRVLEGDEPRLRFFAPMLWGIEETPALLKALNGINLVARAGRVAWTGNEVVAFMDVPGRLVDRPHLEHALGEIGLLADHFDQTLQNDFGGHTVFGVDVPAKPAAHPGYL